ncbi:MAG: hypothetical protein H8E30_18935 [Alphaproteobacteria bacterium]|nr:hypothetical protein [Alphaproteobacteria bacterium]
MSREFDHSENTLLSPRTKNYLKIEGPETIISPQVKIFYDYWRSRHSDGALPTWSDIDLVEIYKLTPGIAVKDVLDGGRDFRNRYWGTGLVRAYDFDATGKTFADYLDQKSADEGLAFHRSVVKMAQPRKSSGTMAFWKSKTYVSFEGLVCPLRGDSGGVEFLISYYDLNLRDVSEYL